MRKILTAGFAAAVLGCGTITLAAPSNAETTSHAATQAWPVTGQIIVKFRDSGSAAGVLRQHGLGEGPVSAALGRGS